MTAEILLAHSLGIRRLDLYLQHDRPLQDDELAGFKALIRQRCQNEPVAYITGEKGFFESDFKVKKGVLIPRPDTETIVEQALRMLGDTETGPSFKRVLELGTGSGAIVVSLAKAEPRHLYFATDISLKAVKTAKKNADRLVNSDGRVNASKMDKEGIGFFCSPWFDALKPDPKFDLIVSNPPYIPTRDIEGLAPEIREFEPRQALDGGEDGLDCYRSILSCAHQYLVPGGTLLLEMGHDQEQGIALLVKNFSRYEAPGFVKDLAGHTRVAIIQKSID